MIRKIIRFLLGRKFIYGDKAIFKNQYVIDSQKKECKVISYHKYENDSRRYYIVKIDKVKTVAYPNELTREGEYDYTDEKKK